MSRINRVTTKSGDRGKTSLAPGLRVDKSDFSIRALGSVDELSAFLGLLRTELIQKEEETEIEQIQQITFEIGAIISTSGSYSSAKTERGVAALEETIQNLNDNLEPLKEFVVPGGNKANALYHVCRTVTRRAEREIWAFFKSSEALVEEKAANIINAATYLNRLSDLLFVRARANQARSEEKLWHGPEDNLN
tara:strand:- start:12 stop:590 length:579 start_codon:yes stop_codon:yes gene_type:complete